MWYCRYYFEGRICKKLRCNNNIGLIDEDPESIQPEYLRDLRIIDDFQNLDITVKIDGVRNNKFIILCPKLEGWIIKTARQLRINLDEEFNLSNDENRLHHIINNRLKNLESVIGVFKKINSNRIMILKELLNDKRIRLSP